MDNHGKIWSIDHDQQLMENPQYPNSYFASCMGRSENAIKCRRTHLAAKLHQKHPDTPLHECVALMGGDIEQAQGLIQQWAEKQASLTTFMDANRKRKAVEMSSMLPSPSSNRSPFFQPQQAQHAQHAQHAQQASFEARSVEERIATICRSIREEGGNLSSIFNDPDFLPCLVQHYPGFEAYARVVQARTTGQ
jgi:hypothetical protein